MGYSTDFTGRFDLDLDAFLRYCTSQYQISNAVGMWCYYGSTGKDGYHMVVPTAEHVEAVKWPGRTSTAIRMILIL